MSEIFQPSILYVDDESSNTFIFQKAFEKDYMIQVAHSGKEALAFMEKRNFSLCLIDQRMPEMSGIELCEKLIAQSPDTVRMMVTAYQDPDLLLQAINKGHVFDYVVKPWQKLELQEVIERGFSHYRQRMAKLKKLNDRVGNLTTLLEKQNKSGFDNGWVGQSPAWMQVKSAIEKVAPSDSTITLYGETGTGKEVVAKHIHRLSPRASDPFVPVHCAGLSKTLLESELFGHEKGAFTGADKTKKGLFEIADGGTVFLDEIGEIDHEVQVKLLRTIQEKTVMRVGATEARKVDIRIVTATNKDLEEEVRQGRFREDLFYRLNVIPVTLPALRMRGEDVLILAKHFLSKLNQSFQKDIKLGKSAIKALTSYDWPGNIRELQNVLERAVALVTTDTLEADDLYLTKSSVQTSAPAPLAKSKNIRTQIKELQKKELEQAFLNAKGNISKTARNLGIPRSTLNDQLKKYGLI